MKKLLLLPFILLAASFCFAEDSEVPVLLSTDTFVIYHEILDDDEICPAAEQDGEETAEDYAARYERKPLLDLEAYNKNPQEFTELMTAFLKDLDISKRMDTDANRLTAEYRPKDLVLASGKVSACKADIYLKKEVVADLKKMFSAARTEGVSLQLVSGYRSYTRQANMYKQRLASAKAAAKNKGLKGQRAQDFVDKKMTKIARPGFSQHHYGVAADINAYAGTRQFIWMQKNAQAYGFVQTFTGVNDTLLEEWHYRYFGAAGVKLMNTYFNSDWRAMMIFVDKNIKRTSETAFNFEIDPAYFNQKFNKDKFNFLKNLI